MADEVKKHSFSTIDTEISIDSAGDKTVGTNLNLSTAGTYLDRDIEIKGKATIKVPASTVTKSGDTITHTAGWVEAGSEKIDGGALSVNDNTVTVSTGGYLAQGTSKTVADGGLANTATTGVTYSTVTGPALNPDSEGKYWLYINKGWQGNGKVDLGDLIPDDTGKMDVDSTDKILKGYIAYNEKGQKIVGTMETVNPTFTGGTVSGSVTDITGSSVTVGTTDTYGTGIYVNATASASRGAVTYNGDYTGAIDKSQGTQALAAGSSTALTSRKEYINAITIPSGKTFGNSSNNAISIAGMAYEGVTGTANIKFPTSGSGTVAIAGTTVAKNGALVTTTRSAGSTTINEDTKSTTASLTAKAGDSASAANPTLTLLDTAPTSGTYYTVNAKGDSSVTVKGYGSVSTGTGWITEGSTNSTEGSKTVTTSGDVDMYIKKSTVSSTASVTNPKAQASGAATGFTASSTATDYYVTATVSQKSAGSATPKHSATEGYTPAVSAASGTAASIGVTIDTADNNKKIYIPAGSATPSVTHNLTAPKATYSTSSTISDSTNYSNAGVLTAQPTSGVYLTIAPTISSTKGSTDATGTVTKVKGMIEAGTASCTKSTKDINITETKGTTRYIKVYTGAYTSS